MTSGSLFKLLAMISRGWFCFVGRPGAVMNYIHVDDVAGALALCATSDAAIAADEMGVRRPSLRVPETPLRVLASLLERVLGSPLTHRNLDAVTQWAHYASDRIVRDLAYNAEVDLQMGLRELVRTWRRRG
jgi:nucleoside-diphosphate-sugar epimerase